MQRVGRGGMGQEFHQLKLNLMSPFLNRAVREAWIKAKYIERKFVKPLAYLTSSEHRASREMMPFQKWSVRKLRRRPRSRDKSDSQSRGKTLTLLAVKEAHNSTSSEDGEGTSTEGVNFVGRCKPVDRNSESSEDSPNLDYRNKSTLYCKILNKTTNSNEDLKEDSPESSDKSSTSSNSDISNNQNLGDTVETKEETGDVLMFGCDLPKPTIDGCLELSSDQDSTAGEDEEFADEEDIENLHPEMLLYKAAAAHNLPVMSSALAAGADKLWTNVNDKGRSALHQAIISVSVDLSYFLDLFFHSPRICQVDKIFIILFRGL